MSPHATAAPRRPFPNGVYCPLITPFLENEELDIPAWETQVLRLAKAGMGLVLLGTNGEASHLSDEERVTLISSARKTLDQNGFPDLALLVGTGAGSAHQSIKLAVQAKEAGADYSILIAPGYFAFAMGKNRGALKDFFTEVMDKSPIPVMIYNFPGAASGIDLDSDILEELSEHPNCFGAKVGSHTYSSKEFRTNFAQQLTCAGIGKGHRLAMYTQSEAYLARHSPFQVLPGFSDYLLPALVSRQTGCITGTGNCIPKTIVKLYKTATAALASGDPKLMQEALKLQDIVSTADWCIVKAGIGGTKYCLDLYVQKGLGGAPRSPLPKADSACEAMVAKGMKASMAYENSLP
ncbi:4-hydroxy-2-oxoglutarate aldolase, partial [Phenoliferia sp. Uapishka_3]